MNPKDFQTNALRTESIPENINVDYEAIICALNIAVTAGDVVDAIKKALYYGKEINQEKFVQQLRDLSEFAMEMRAMNRANDIIAPIMFPIDPTHTKDLRVLHGALGMFTEAAEMAKAVRDFAVAEVTGPNSVPEFDVVNFCEEMGDSDWYKAILHDALGISEEQIRATVIAKLQKRYPGKFTTEAAINRDVVAERVILEDGIAYRAASAA